MHGSINLDSVVVGSRLRTDPLARSLVRGFDRIPVFCRFPFVTTQSRLGGEKWKLARIPPSPPEADKRHR